MFGVPPKADTVESYRDAGFTRVVVGLPQGDEAAILLELGRRRMVGGQEDMIVDVALDLAGKLFYKRLG